MFLCEPFWMWEEEWHRYESQDSKFTLYKLHTHKPFHWSVCELFFFFFNKNIKIRLYSSLQLSYFMQKLNYASGQCGDSRTGEQGVVLSEAIRFFSLLTSVSSQAERCRRPHCAHSFREGGAVVVCGSTCGSNITIRLQTRHSVRTRPSSLPLRWTCSRVGPRRTSLLWLFVGGATLPLQASVSPPDEWRWWEPALRRDKALGNCLALPLCSAHFQG